MVNAAEINFPLQTVKSHLCVQKTERKNIKEARRFRSLFEKTKVE